MAELTFEGCDLGPLCLCPWRFLGRRRTLGGLEAATIYQPCTEGLDCWHSTSGNPLEALFDRHLRSYFEGLSLGSSRVLSIEINGGTVLKAGDPGKALRANLRLTGRQQALCSS